MGNREGTLEVRGFQGERLELGRGCQDQSSLGLQEEGAVFVALCPPLPPLPTRGITCLCCTHCMPAAQHGVWQMVGVGQLNGPSD